MTVPVSVQTYYLENPTISSSPIRKPWGRLPFTHNKGTQIAEKFIMDSRDELRCIDIRRRFVFKPPLTISVWTIA